MRKYRSWGAGLISALLFTGILWAQASTGTISGVVTDSSGAALPGAQVVLLNVQTGIARTVETDSNGHYSAVSLGLGDYQVTATEKGFQTEVRNGIVLTVGADEVVDLALSVGSVEQSVTVTGAAPLVDTSSASLGALVNGTDIRHLPLNGRSYDQLALLQPGVTLTSPGVTGGAAYAFGTGKKFSVEGQQSTANSFLLDGTDVNDQANGTPGGAAGTNLGVDTIQEFRIYTSDWGAEFGHSSGSVITAVTRSGTNNLHGTAFEYIRNSWLDARNYFDPLSGPPTFRRNQFGGVLGGPIKKNKLFFFAGYEGLRQDLATSLTAIVPDELARQGILPSGNVTVNPAIVPYLNLYPIPQGQDFGNGTAAFLSAPVVPISENNAMGRVDYQLNSKTALFGRYEFDGDSENNPQNLPDYSIYTATRRQYVTVQANSTLTPTVFNNVRFAYNRTNSTFAPTISPPVPAALDLIPGEPLGALNVGGNATALGIQFLGSQSGNGDRLWAFNIFEWADDLSYVRGKHTFKAGVDIQRLRDNTESSQTVRGQLSFNSYQNFLEGIPNQFIATGPPGVTPLWGLRQSIFAAYAEDEYAVTPRLTVNLGLRWEISTDPTDADGRASMLPSVSSPATVPSSDFFSVGKKNFEPRLGLAWQVTGDGKTVLRAAAGIYHDDILPWAYQLNILNPPYFERYNALNPPFPNPYTALVPGGPFALSLMAPSVKTPTVYQYNLSIQHQISRSTMAQVAYSGSEGRHLETEEEKDTFTPTFPNGNLADPFFPAGAPRLNPNFTSIQWLQMNGNSSYNAVTVSLRSQSASGLVGQVAYTFAKALDDSSTTSASEDVRSPQLVLNPFDLRQDWGLSDFNVKHAVVGTVSYPMPFNSSSRTLGAVVNGWTLDGIVTVQSGMPFTPLLVGSVSRDGAATNAERPNLNPGASNNPTHGISAGCSGFPAGTQVGTAKNWYDPCAFSVPLAGTFGDLGRNTVIGPGFADADVALEKEFKFNESVSATFRAEMFNALNRANFGLPNVSAVTSTGPANASAGLITYTADSSRQLQFALRINF